MDNKDKKSELPIHLKLGANEYSIIKTETKPRIGKPSEPIAELTMLGWAMMSSGKETGLSNVYLTKSSAADYEQLCSLDVLGFEERPETDQGACMLNSSSSNSEVRKVGMKGGCCGSRVMVVHSQTNTVALRDAEMIDKYDEIIQKQLKEGIVERVVEEPNERVFYIPHKPVKREMATTRKLRIAFDVSTKPSEESPSSEYVVGCTCT